MKTNFSFGVVIWIEKNPYIVLEIRVVHPESIHQVL